MLKIDFKLKNLKRKTKNKILLLLLM